MGPTLQERIDIRDKMVAPEAVTLTTEHEEPRKDKLVMQGNNSPQNSPSIKISMYILYTEAVGDMSFVLIKGFSRIK